MGGGPLKVRKRSKIPSKVVILLYSKWSVKSISKTTHQLNMKPILFLFFLFSTPIFAQQVYQPNEVDTKAEPSGGNMAWMQFINANIEVPFRRQISGIDSKVVIRGIVEPDGSMNNLSVLRGVDAECDAEALRILKLYKAWKPAKLGETKVRQEQVVLIPLKLAPLTGFDTSLHAFVDYFDEKFILTNDMKAAAFRRVLPVDSSGTMLADVVYEMKNGKKWKNRYTVPLQKKDTTYIPSVNGSTNEPVRALHVYAKDENGANYGFSSIKMQDATPLAYVVYDIGNKMILEKKHDISGLVRSVSVFNDSTYKELGFYENGLVMYQREVPIPQQAKTSKNIRWIACWSSDGNQLLKEGNGYWRIPARVDGKDIFMEEGGVTNGKKNGIWTAKAADSTIYYREVYEADVLKEGYVMQNGQRITYSKPTIYPEFEGGINQFYRFLASNIHYPVGALRRGAAGGRVVVSFTVCEDGSLCDYEVLEGAGSGFEKEAVRVVKKSSGKWVPGMLRGQKVRVKYRLPINFARQ